MNKHFVGVKMRVAVAFGALALAAAPLYPAVALVSPGPADSKNPDTGLPGAQGAASEEKSCQDGLRFGITVDKIPHECRASLVKTLGQKEKWEYSKGYLFFDNGVLMAIREMKP